MATDIDLIDRYFTVLEDWKQLPAYRLEPRVDALVGFFIADIVRAKLGAKCGVRGVIPELPIRLGTVHPEHDARDFADRSYKVDFYVLTEAGENLFIEFKTDSGSRREKQDQYLSKSVDLGMSAILSGIARIRSVSSYRKKYDYLKAKLEKLELISSNGETFTPRPTSDRIQVLYVQPKRLSDDDADGVISFAEVAECLREAHPESDLVDRFCKSLLAWAGD